MKFERAVILGAFIFAIIAPIRHFLFLGLPAWFICFFGPEFAVFCTSSLIVRAMRQKGWRFVVANSILASTLLVLWPLYINIFGIPGFAPAFSLSKFVRTPDFRMIVTNALFALLAAFAASMVIVRLRPNNSFKPTPLRG